MALFIARLLRHITENQVTRKNCSESTTAQFSKKCYSLGTQCLLAPTIKIKITIK